jgi:hypothetical protein
MASYVIQSETLESMADEVRDLVDSSDKMNPNQMTTNIAQANADVEAQVGLIAQIKTALDGKAAGSGSEIIAQIAALIDQSGVLGTTDGTATEKVERLIDKAESHSWLKERYLEGKYMLFQKSTQTYFPEGMDFSNLTTMAYMFNDNKNLTVMPDIGSTAKVKSFDHCWAGCSSLTELPPLDLSGCTDVGYLATATAIKSLTLYNTAGVRNWAQLANGCSNLETISTLDCSGATSFVNWLNASLAVKNLSFRSETIKVSIAIASPVLSDESIQSIIDGLATVTTAQTLTLHATVKAKLTDDQKKAISDKNWNLA